MKDLIFDSFQNAVDESLLRHKSVLDIITKLQESQARINRALAKSVTNCGCIQINAKKQEIDKSADSMETICNSLKTHLDGALCDSCKETIENEMGNNIFYLASLCNILNLNLYDIFIKEYNMINTLGKYTLK